MAGEPANSDAFAPLRLLHHLETWEAMIHHVCFKAVGRAYDHRKETLARGIRPRTPLFKLSLADCN